MKQTFVDTYLNWNICYWPQRNQWTSWHWFVFQVAIEYFSQKKNFDYDSSLNFWPYWRLIGIDKSTSDSYINNSKNLELNANLHDAGGFIQEIYADGAVYSYKLPCRLNGHLRGHLTGILFCLYTKIFQSKYINCWNVKQ